LSLLGFSIQFVDDYDKAAGYLWHKGAMLLGTDEERFRSLIHDWREPDYERQWHDALASIVAGAPYAFLLTIVSPAGSREMYETWPLARSGDEIRMRNVLRPPGPFPDVDPADAFKGDGEFSEWRFSVRDVETFLAQHGD
jgi:hypothetical protein